jgi:hypothetical protein
MKVSCRVASTQQAGDNTTISSRHEEINSKAASTLEKARSAGSIYGQYLANTVLFATVLFFASMPGKFEQQRVRVVAFAFCCGGVRICARTDGDVAI